MCREDTALRRVPAPALGRACSAQSVPLPCGECDPDAQTVPQLHPFHCPRYPEKTPEESEDVLPRGENCAESVLFNSDKTDEK